MGRESSNARVAVLMSDGSPATIRPVAAGDRDALLALHDGLDEQTLRMRFFNVSRSSGRHYVHHVLDGEPGPVVSLVAVVEGTIVALGTAERITPGEAEVAFVVADALRGHGLGTLLLEQLAATCDRLGVTRLVADVLPDNRAMTQVFDDAGFELDKHLESGVIRYELRTTSTATSRLASRERRHRAKSGPRPHHDRTHHTPHTHGAGTRP